MNKFRYPDKIKVAYAFYTIKKFSLNVILDIFSFCLVPVPVVHAFREITFLYTKVLI